MILELAKLLKPTTVDKMPLAKKPNRKNKIDNWAAPDIGPKSVIETSQLMDCSDT
jgi:hypothetical protein